MKFQYPIFISFGLFLGFALGCVSCHSQTPPETNEGSLPDSITVEPIVTPTPLPDPNPASLIYSWKTDYDQEQSIAKRVAVPKGYQRLEVAEGSFGEWLRYLPLKPGTPSVYLYNGNLKGNQSAHHAVIDMDVGKRDLQQCADAVMRVRAEYLYSKEQYDKIHFNFVSGENCNWDRWREGQRPKVSGSKTTWSKTHSADNAYPNFKKYLQTVFMFAGTASLTHELDPISDASTIEPGNVFILGGSPGHAIIVVDVAEHPTTGERLFLLAQSYMPAQEMHVLKNPNNGDLSPWYSADFGQNLETPEWYFQADDLKKF